MELDNFIEQEHEHMLTNLRLIVADLIKDMAIDPKMYTEIGDDEPGIDIRLCIDLKPTASWIFRTGSSDYDQYHSEYCAGSFIGLETNPKELLQELLTQID